VVLRKPGEQVAPLPVAASPRIRPISVVPATGHQIHHVRQRGYVERPVRVRQILKGLEGLPIETVTARRFPERHITAVHDPKLVSYLHELSKRLDEKTIVYPEVFPIRRPDRAPKALEDRAGYFCADTFTPITNAVYAAARHSVDVALTAAELVLHGERYAYALCRPPGHHAERRIFGGFCYFNNSAIAANHLCSAGKVALLDLDYHHGNGAQDIFYARSDVCTLSIHGHPRNSYPNFSGYADERGEGAGTGFNRNWPLEPPVDDDRYIEVLNEALGAVRRFRPDYLVVSLGFDIMRGDPTGSFDISTAGLERIAERLASLRLPTLIVQEGGYAVRNLRIGARAFFGRLAESWFGLTTK
jgi:acetoin utilization deacetylase AcuC-like enzyme